jgi:Ser/Thr protein kinase RdoA (MazF antagonist)
MREALMVSNSSADYPEVFSHFGVEEARRPTESCYQYAPVFPSVVGGRRAAIKRTRGPESAAAAIAGWTGGLAGAGVAVVTPLELAVGNPVLLGKQMWVAYPWIDGRPYSGSTCDIAAAGDLLGRMHALSADQVPGMPVFPWPEHGAESVTQDIEDLRRVISKNAPDIDDDVVDRMAAGLESFMTDTLPVIRDGSLPLVAASLDFRAANLVYVGDAAVLIDPDGAERAPRVLDLAMAALLFHYDHSASPPRLFDEFEWALFLDAYAQHVELTVAERAVWRTAMLYMIVEWGAWVLIDAEDCNDWADPREREFLIDLALTHADRYRLGRARRARRSDAHPPGVTRVLARQRQRQRPRTSPAVSSE